MRIDKFLSNAGAGSRSQVKTDLKKGLVLEKRTGSSKC